MTESTPDQADESVRKSIPITRFPSVLKASL